MLRIDGTCNTMAGDSDSSRVISEYPWHYDIYYGDGTSNSGVAIRDLIHESKVYQKSGRFRIEVYIYCGCNSLLNVFTYGATVEVHPEPKKEVPWCWVEESVIDDIVHAELRNIEPNPYEEYFIANCLLVVIVLSERTKNDPNDPNLTDEQRKKVDPCTAKIHPRPGVATVAIAHSHPWFETVDEMNAGWGCGGKRDHDKEDLEKHQKKLYHGFSVQDILSLRKVKLDGFLVDGTDTRRKYFKYDYETLTTTRL